MEKSRLLLMFSVSGQTCQQAGSKCYSVTTAPLGVVGGSCCNSCRPYIADGQTSWDGTTDWYCQYGSTGGSEGSTCVSTTSVQPQYNLSATDYSIISNLPESIYWFLCHWTILCQRCLFLSIHHCQLRHHDRQLLRHHHCQLF